MIIVRISGGLGNQMFQYSFARALQARGKQVLLHWHSHHSKNCHNGFELDQIFTYPHSNKIPLVTERIDHRLQAWWLRKRNRIREIHELQFQPHFLEMSSGYLDGYWQTEKYFEDIADTIRNDFQFQPLESQQNQRLLETIRSKPCCSVHVRRGDYVNHPELGGICDEAYYRCALAELDSREPNCFLVVFSDDIPYCQSIFNDRNNVIYCDWNQGAKSWMDMALMSQCKHHIIANSSFSWWGAWLGNKTGITIAPGIWSAKFSEGNDVISGKWCTI